MLRIRSSHRRCPIRKGVLRNFTKFIGKHLRHSLFFNKVAGHRAPLDDCFCKIEKKSAFFSGNKEIPQRNAILSQENFFTRIQYLIFPGCLEFALQIIIIQNASISHARRQTFTRAPNFVNVPQLCTIPNASKRLGKNSPQSTFFYRTACSGFCQISFIFLKKGKKQTETVFCTSSVLDTLEIL